MLSRIPPFVLISFFHTLIEAHFILFGLDSRFMGRALVKGAQEVAAPAVWAVQSFRFMMTELLGSCSSGLTPRKLVQELPLRPCCPMHTPTLNTWHSVKLT